MYLEREISQRIQRLVSVFPVVVLGGARQVGKSTLLGHLFGQSFDTVVLDPVIDIENARADPELFLANHPKPLIIDEIQYAPELVAAIKRRVDTHRKPGQFILTGSQQWEVIKSLAESLAGRVVFLDLEGLSLREIAQESGTLSWLSRWLNAPESLNAGNIMRLTQVRTLNEQLWRGFLPEAQFLPDDVISVFHASYRRTYIERDVSLLADISDRQLFGRFVGLLSALTAQEINASQLGRELGISPQTARRWVDILTATYQWFEVPAYSNNAVKKVSQKAKGYIGDTGAACSAQAISSPQALASVPIFGALFESAVVAELRKLIAPLTTKPNIYHWRLHSGAEVDIILEHNGMLFPIEIKSKSQIQPKDTRGIEAFRLAHKNLNVAKGLVIAPCARFLNLGAHASAMPWDAI